MTEESARANIITPFKNLGILDETGKPTDLAYEWRDDSKYPVVCQTLLDKIYPQEVRDLYPSTESDPNALKSWFMNYCRCGESAAKMFTTFYRLLLKADPSASAEPTTQKPKPLVSSRQVRRTVSKAQTVVEPKETKQRDVGTSSIPEKRESLHGRLPQLHINIQLHISPDAPHEQIDKIFESMARHLKDFKI